MKGLFVPYTAHDATDDTAQWTHCKQRWARYHETSPTSPRSQAIKYSDSRTPYDANPLGTTLEELEAQISPGSKSPSRKEDIRPAKPQEGDYSAKYGYHYRAKWEDASVAKISKKQQSPKNHTTSKAISPTIPSSPGNNQSRRKAITSREGMGSSDTEKLLKQMWVTASARKL